MLHAMAGFDDLQGTMQAAVMLFLLVAAGGLAFAFRAPPDLRRILWAVAVTAAMTGAFFAARARAPDAGLPVGQLAAGIVGAWACAFVGSPRVANLCSVLFLIATLGLIAWYGALVRHGYVGQAAVRDAKRESLDHALAEYGELLIDRGRDDPQNYKPGWLDQSSLYEAYRY